MGTWIEAFSLWLVMWLLIVCGVAWLLLGLGLSGRKIYSVGVLWLGLCGSGRNLYNVSVWGCGSVACIYSVGGPWLGFCGSGKNLYIVCVWFWGSVACMVVAGLLNCSFLVRGVII